MLTSCEGGGVVERLREFEFDELVNRNGALELVALTSVTKPFSVFVASIVTELEEIQSVSESSQNAFACNQFLDHFLLLFYFLFFLF